MNVGSIATMPFRAVKNYSGFVFGTGNNAFSESLKNSAKAQGYKGFWSQLWGNKGLKGFWGQLKEAFAATGKHNAEVKAASGGLFKIIKGLGSQFTGIGKETMAGWKSGSGIFSKLWGGTKGLGTGLGKAMPLIGAALQVFSEAPTIIEAYKDKGIKGAAAEVGKTAVRLGVGSVASAIGQFLIPIPFVGSMIGWTAGSWLVNKVLGKSYNVQKAEAEATGQQTGFNMKDSEQKITSLPKLNTYDNTDIKAYNPLSSNPYADYRKYANY